MDRWTTRAAVFAAAPFLTRCMIWVARRNPDQGAEVDKRHPAVILQAAGAFSGCLALPREIAGLACRILKESRGMWRFRKALHTVWGLLSRSSGIRA